MNHIKGKTTLSIWLDRLFTKEDAFNVHKSLGVLALLSYSWRLCRVGERDMGFATHPDLTIPTLLLHWSLSLSSFEFRIPTQRILSDGGRIWPEFRLHSLVFLSRHLAAIAIIWYENNFGLERDYSRNFWIVIAAMVAADISSSSVGDKHSNSIRDLSAPILVKYYFSVMQFYATASVLYGLRRCSLYFFQVLVIQITAFLLTLRRKNLVSHSFNVVAYGMLLAGAVSVGYSEFVFHKDAPTRGDHKNIWIVSAVACTAALWRMGPWPDDSRIRAICANKYLIWTVMYFVLNQVLRPVFQREDHPGTQPTRDQIQWLVVGEWVVLVVYGMHKHFVQQRYCRQKPGNAIA